MQHGDKYELRIDNQSFTHLYEQGKHNIHLSVVLEKTKIAFNLENNEREEDHYVQKDYSKQYANAAPSINEKGSFGKGLEAPPSFSKQEYARQQRNYWDDPSPKFQAEQRAAASQYWPESQ